MDPDDARRLIRAFYAAFDDRPYEISVAPFLDGDVVWHVAGDNPLAGRFTGVPAVLDAMRAYASASAGTLRLDTITLLADQHHVVAIHAATAEAPGFAYAAHEVDVFHLRENRITTFWSFSEDQPATDRLWSRSARACTALGPSPCSAPVDTAARVERRLAARGAGTTIPRDPDLDLPTAYAVATELERRLTERGHRRVGRKIGFTNRATWAELGLDTPIWAPVYDSTLTRDTTVDLAHIPEPRLEPEIVVVLAADLEPGGEVVVAQAFLGVEIVASHHAGWRFSPAEAVADFGVHARLVVGPALPDDHLAGLTCTLTAPDGTTTTGRGADVLGGPIDAVAALAALPDAAPVRAGEMITTGTLVTPPWVAPGQRWAVAVEHGPELVIELV